MDDRVIDISPHLDGSNPDHGGAFSIWGGDGVAARFALPVWRAIHSLGGDRGGIISTDETSPQNLETHFFLDLGQDPARTETPLLPSSVLESLEPPAVAPFPEGRGVAVYLGRDGDRRWFLVLLGGEGPVAVTGRQREDLLFLAGECAGLLFFRGFAGR